MLTGGIAANYYGSIRATQDLDICICISEEDVEKLVEGLYRIGLEKLEVDDIKTIVKTGNRFFCYEPKKFYRIDFWLIKTATEKEMLDGRVKGKIDTEVAFFYFT